MCAHMCTINKKSEGGGGQEEQFDNGALARPLYISSRPPLWGCHFGAVPMPHGHAAFCNLSRCEGDYGERNHYACHAAGGEARLRPPLIDAALQAAEDFLFSLSRQL